ncbi:hypothetical protein LTR85_011428 [Meristemomyces frigidus]|nr:hypothetical protein LTR85_011428 [Meristemomyces frigidus]
MTYNFDTIMSDGGYEEMEDTGRKASQLQLSKASTTLNANAEEFQPKFGNNYDLIGEYTTKKKKHSYDDAKEFLASYKRMIAGTHRYRVVGRFDCRNCRRVHDIYDKLVKPFERISTGGLREQHEADIQRVVAVTCIGKSVVMNQMESIDDIDIEDKDAAVWLFADDRKVANGRDGTPKTLRHMKGTVRRMAQEMRQ